MGLMGRGTGQLDAHLQLQSHRGDFLAEVNVGRRGLEEEMGKKEKQGENDHCKAEIYKEGTSRE